jgi:hypothetical protein
VRAILRIATFLGLLLAASGCLETHEEIFGPDDAVLVPGIEGKYTEQGGKDEDAVAVERISGTRDYAYFDPKDPKHEPGRLRAVALGSDTYLVQLRADDWPPGHAWQLVFKVHRKGDSVESVVLAWPEDDAIEALAAKSGVVLGPSDKDGAFGPKVLSGSRAAVAAFLKSLATLPLRDAVTYLRN